MLNERVPCVDLFAQAVSLTQNPLGGALVRPEIGFAGPSVEVVDAGLLGD